MWEWLSKLVIGGGNTNDLTVPDASKGYTAEYAQERVREIRFILVQLREHASDIQTLCAGNDRQVPELTERACANIEKVCQILKADPKDFSNIGTELEAIPELEKLLGHCVKFARIRMDEAKVHEALELAVTSLKQIGDKFDRLSQGVLHVDDRVNADSLKRAIQMLVQ